MKPSNELISLVNSALNAEAYIETIRPTFDAIHARILEEVKPVVESRWDWYKKAPPVGSKIEKWDDVCFSNDDQSDKCYKLSIKYQEEAGLKAKPNCCALLEAEELHRNALREMTKQAVVDFNMPLTYDDLMRNVMKMRELQDLVLKAVVTYCAENNIELKAYA